MRLQEQGVPLSGSAELTARQGPSFLSSVVNFIYKTLVITELEARKLRHDPIELVTRVVQPALWLLVFGQVFTRTRIIDTGNLRYLDFMAPGVLAQSSLFIAIFSGMSIIWERDLGIVHKFLATPSPRTALVLGKALSGGVRALPQAAMIYALALVLGVKVAWNSLSLLGVLLAVLLAAAAFSSFSMIIAFIVKSRERFMGIGQVLTMPFFFASNAIYPISIMPGWLKVIAHMNPLTYEVDALRGLMLTSGPHTYPYALDFGVLAFATTVLVVIGGKLYPNVVS